MTFRRPISHCAFIFHNFLSDSFSDVHWSVVLSHFGVWGCIEAAIILAARGKFCLPESQIDRWLIYCIGIASFLGQIFMIVSAKFESATNVALLRQSFDFILAFIVQISLFGVS